MPQFPEKTWVRDGLVSYWPLDNEQLVGSPPGATVRDVIGGNDGVTSGTITTGVTGKINEAFDFDGVTTTLPWTIWCTMELITPN